MVTSAGIAIIYQDKVLLAHPTGGGDNMWGIPKGKVEVGETLKQAASRETKEEIGVYINPDKLEKSYEIKYKNRKNKKTYKKVYYFIHKIKNLKEIKLNSFNIPKKLLHLAEIDDAKFMTSEESAEIIFWRQREILDFIQ